MPPEQVYDSGTCRICGGFTTHTNLCDLVRAARDVVPELVLANGQIDPAHVNSANMNKLHEAWKVFDRRVST